MGLVGDEPRHLASRRFLPHPRADIDFQPDAKSGLNQNHTHQHVIFGLDATRHRNAILPPQAILPGEGMKWLILV